MLIQKNQEHALHVAQRSVDSFSLTGCAQIVRDVILLTQCLVQVCACVLSFIKNNHAGVGVAAPLDVSVAEEISVPTMTISLFEEVQKNNFSFR